MAYVYCITNLFNGKKYIGSSRKENIVENYYGSGRLISNAIKKYGIYNFVRDILWEGPAEFSRDIETYWLEYFNCKDNNLFYNLTNDARGNSLHKEETKKTVSEKLKGRKFSKEICNKISLSKIGKPNSKKGKSDGSKPAVSQAHKGRISPNKGKGKQVALYDITTNKHIKTYPSYYELAIDIQLNPETVRCQLVGKAKTLKKGQFRAQYV